MFFSFGTSGKQKFFAFSSEDGGKERGGKKRKGESEEKRKREIQPQITEKTGEKQKAEAKGENYMRKRGGFFHIRFHN